MIIIEESQIIRTATDTPITFEVGRLFKKRFNVYPASLGRSLLLQRIYQRIGLNVEALKVNAAEELLRVATIHKQDVCRVIALSSLTTKEDLLNEYLIEKLIRYFDAKLSVDELASLFLMVTTQDETEAIIELKIAQDRKEKEILLKQKSKDSRIAPFGGTTIYGLTLDTLLARYGWSFDYLMWGVSYANIRLLMADVITHVPLGDKEERHSIINADDPKNWEAINKELLG